MDNRVALCKTVVDELQRQLPHVFTSAHNRGTAATLIAPGHQVNLIFYDHGINYTFYTVGPGFNHKVVGSSFINLSDPSSLDRMIDRIITTMRQSA